MAENISGSIQDKVLTNDGDGQQAEETMSQQLKQHLKIDDGESCFNALPVKVFQKILALLRMADMKNLRRVSNRLATLVIENDERMQEWRVNLKRGKVAHANKILTKAAEKDVHNLSNFRLHFSVHHQEPSMGLLTAWKDWIVGLDIVVDKPFPIHLPKLENLAVFRRFGIDESEHSVMCYPNMDCSDAKNLIRSHIGQIKKLMIGEDLAFAPLASDYIDVNDDIPQPVALDYLSLTNLPKEAALPVALNWARNVTTLDFVPVKARELPFLAGGADEEDYSDRGNNTTTSDFDFVFPNLKKLKISAGGLPIMVANADRIETFIYESFLLMRDPLEFPVLPKVKHVMIQFMGYGGNAAAKHNSLLANLLAACRTANSLIMEEVQSLGAGAAVKMDNLIELAAPQYNTWVSTMVDLNKHSLKLLHVDMKDCESKEINIEPPYMALKKVTLFNCKATRKDVAAMKAGGVQVATARCRYDSFLKFVMKHRKIEKGMLFPPSSFLSHVWD
eukprot:TRINITY_DN21095_c0_g1_i2.p1 TRINITY_DN21095_c0_g1~~TRINITY_DN21095_c0_g1_i2.p1  ORF type:complete len:514 (+),score=156.81 TRINITY_DN21095_c0_g1_i2:28-1542(+)